jgi:hypothetical protein
MLGGIAGHRMRATAMHMLGVIVMRVGIAGIGNIRRGGMSTGQRAARRNAITKCKCKARRQRT